MSNFLRQPSSPHVLGHRCLPPALWRSALVALVCFLLLGAKSSQAGVPPEVNGRILGVGVVYSQTLVGDHYVVTLDNINTVPVLVGLATYKAPHEGLNAPDGTPTADNLKKQVLFDVDQVWLAPGNRVELTAKIPLCVKGNWNNNNCDNNKDKDNKYRRNCDNKDKDNKDKDNKDKDDEDTDNECCYQVDTYVGSIWPCDPTYPPGILEHHQDCLTEAQQCAIECDECALECSVYAHSCLAYAACGDWKNCLACAWKCQYKDEECHGWRNECKQKHSDCRTECKDCDDQSQRCDKELDKLVSICRSWWG